MNVIQKLVDRWRHPGETPDQRAHRRGTRVFEGRAPQYRSTVNPPTKSTDLADQEREHRLSLLDRGQSFGSSHGYLGALPKRDLTQPPGPPPPAERPSVAPQPPRDREVS